MLFLSVSAQPAPGAGSEGDSTVALGGLNGVPRQPPIQGAPTVAPVLQAPHQVISDFTVVRCEFKPLKFVLCKLVNIA